MKTFLIKVKDADDVGINEVERYEVDAYMVSYANSPRVHGLFEGTKAAAVVDNDKAAKLKLFKKQAQMIDNMKHLLDQASKIDKDTPVGEDPKSIKIMEAIDTMNIKIKKGESV